MKRIIVLVGVCFFIIACKSMAEELKFEKGDPVGKPRAISRVDFENFGGINIRFGDLDADGTPDVVVYQSRGQQITCLTALDLKGNKLWQKGKPDVKNGMATSDIATQIYDWDQDSKNEVLYIEGTILKILDGATGTSEKEYSVPSNDSILIANFSGTKHPSDILIKDRYRKFWVYDKKMKLLWEKETNTGHYPMNIDVNGDGRDELLCGYTLFGPDGKVLWTANGIADEPHNDAVDIDDMDADGKPEFAIACSRASALLDVNGKLLWEKDHKHSQHAVIGSFLPNEPGKQVVFLDRVDSVPSGGVAYCYNKEGKELWRTPPQGWITMLSTIDGWTGNPRESFVLAFQRVSCHRYYGHPVLLNGEGKIVAEFPFPPASEAKDTANQWRYCHYVQHFDAVADSREEIFISSPKALWVYENAAPAPENLPEPDRRPNPRVYNSSAYVGQQ